MSLQRLRRASALSLLGRTNAAGDWRTNGDRQRGGSFEVASEAGLSSEATESKAAEDGLSCERERRQREEISSEKSTDELSGRKAHVYERSAHRIKKKERGYQSIIEAYSLKDQQLQLSSLWRIGQVLVDEVQQGTTLILALKVRWMAREPLLQQTARPIRYTRAPRAPRHGTSGYDQMCEMCAGNRPPYY